MASNEVKLGAPSSEVVLPQIGRKLVVNQIETTREARTTDGTMWKDIIHIKHEIFLNYETITGNDLNTILNIYETVDQPMNIIITSGTDGSGGSETYSVYMKPTNRERYRVLDDGLWTGVSFQFKEA